MVAKKKRDFSNKKSFQKQQFITSILPQKRKKYKITSKENTTT